MGLISSVIIKGVETASKKTLIKAAGKAAAMTAVTVGAVAMSSGDKKDKKDKQKDSIVYVKPSRMSEDYIKENALEIANELLGCGFEQVTLKPIKKLGNMSSKKYGRVLKVTINGKDTFLGFKKVPVTSYVIIEYQDFKDDVDESVLKKVKLITPGVMTKTTVAEEAYEEYVATEETVTDEVSQKQYNGERIRKFCPFCGQSLDNPAAKFCFSCGGNLGE